MMHVYEIKMIWNQVVAGFHVNVHETNDKKETTKFHKKNK